MAAAKTVKELRKRQKAAKLAALFGAPSGGTPAVAAGHSLTGNQSLKSEHPSGMPKVCVGGISSVIWSVMNGL